MKGIYRVYRIDIVHGNPFLMIINPYIRFAIKIHIEFCGEYLIGAELSPHHSRNLLLETKGMCTWQGKLPTEKPRYSAQLHFNGANLCHGCPIHFRRGNRLKYGHDYSLFSAARF